MSRGSAIRSCVLILMAWAPAIMPGFAQTAPVSVTFSTSSTWATGYSADIVITNHGPTTISGWTVAFNLPVSGFSKVWNATEGASTATRKAFTNLPTNANIQPGASRSFGFNAIGAFTVPATNFTFNGLVPAGNIPALSIGDVSADEGNHTTFTASTAPATASETHTLRFNLPAADTVTLDGTNTLTGGTVINAGNVILVNAGFGETLQGPITLGGSSRLLLGKADQIADTTVITFASGTNSARFILTNAAGVGYNETIRGLSDAVGTFSGNRIVEAAADGISNSPATLTIDTAAAQSHTFGGIVRNAAGGATNSALSIVKNGPGTQVFSGAAANINYTVGTWLNGANSKLTISGSGTLGSTSGTLLIDTVGAVLDLGATSQTDGPVTLTEGTIQNGTLTGSSYSVASGTVSAALAGSGVALTKTTAGTATLSGVNTYTGDTTVSGGVLAINGTSISDSSKLVIDGGVVDLTGAETVDTLFFGAAQQAAGTYSSDGAGGTIASANFTGTGTLIVTNGPPASGFGSWIATPAFGLAPANQGANADPDNDGMRNLLEYALNGNPSVSDLSILPDLVVTATDFEFTYSRLDLSTADTVQSFEYGTTLVGWTAVAIPVEPGVSTVGIATVTVTDAGSTDTVKVSIPKSVGGKLFGRLQVVR